MLIGMAAAECSTKRRQGRRRGLSACLLIWGVACWLAAGESTRYLALERIFVVISIAAGISALLLLPFLNARHRAKRDASHLFTSYPAKLEIFQVLPGRYLRPDLLLIFTCHHSLILSQNNSSCRNAANGESREHSELCDREECVQLRHCGLKYEGKSGVTHAGFLKPGRKPTLDLPLEVRRKMWFKPSCNPTWWSLSAT